MGNQYEFKDRIGDAVEEKQINDIHYNISVYDYNGVKLCDLYDSQVELDGQAFNIMFETPITGISTLSFSIPYQSGNNFRWDYLKSEYQIRLCKNDTVYWFVANQPEKSKSGKQIIGNVNCESTAAILKTKNIYLEFDDTNGIGTINYLLGQVLRGTGWTLGHVDPQYESDGVTEKVRSITSGGKDGALELITNVCNIFRCRPEFDTDQKILNVYSMKNREQIIEIEVGRNLDSLSVNYNSKDIVTRLYVEGEYGDYGYVGIDDVNPTGLSYLLDFDYYKELGMWTAANEAALQTYLTTISTIKQNISANQEEMTDVEDEANQLIGQCKLALYYVSDGYTNPKYVYGSPSLTQKTLNIGDDVVVLNSNGTHRYAVIATTPGALIKSGDYGIAKFATKAAGSIGGKEVQIEAKEKEILNLERKIAATTRQDKIAEYQREISGLQTEIQNIYNGTNTEEGLYKQMSDVMKPQGILKELNYYTDIRDNLLAEQDDCESDFIIAMGNMLRDGYWANQNYIQGQEQSLYNDALEVMEQMGRPSVTYSVGYVRLKEDYDIDIEDIQMNAIAHVNDEELDIHDNLFISDIIIGIDNKEYGSIEISNQDITLSNDSLSQLLSRMSQLADLIDQKNALYERAKALAQNGTLYTDRLNGQIDVLKNQILSTVSNWYTDERGNLIFLAADGSGAMMLSGAGFMISNAKDSSGEWVWRTFGSGA